MNNFIFCEYCGSKNNYESLKCYSCGAPFTKHSPTRSECPIKVGDMRELSRLAQSQIVQFIDELGIDDIRKTERKLPDMSAWDNAPGGLSVISKKGNFSFKKWWNKHVRPKD